VADGLGGGDQGDGQRQPDGDGALIEAAAAALRRGELVLLPTETVYGLAADAGNPDAVARIFETKGRPRFNPLIAHVADAAAAETLALFDDRARALAKAFWPGPLTLVAPLRPGARVSELARAGLDTVAVRAPAHPVAHAVLEAFGGRWPRRRPTAPDGRAPPPSTTRSRRPASPPPWRWTAVPCRVGLESTVVAALEGELRLLRPGGVTRAQIEAVAGPLAAEAEDDAGRSPGRLTAHYAPAAPLRLEATSPEPGEAYLAFGPAPAAGLIWNLSQRGDLREAAANLFAFLRAADRTRPRAIAVAPIPVEGLGEAINDRLRRAAGFVG
jgi:L-threonylcarbamoyladenylate synthase